MSDKTNWLQNIPEDVRSYVFLVFKVGLLIFHHNHVTLSDYSEGLKHLDSTQEGLYITEMVIHLGIKFIVNILLIWLIGFNVAAITRSWKSKKVSKSLYEHKN